MATKITTNDTCVILASGNFVLDDKADYTSFRTTYIFANDCQMKVNAIKARELHLHTSSFLASSQKATISTSGDPGISRIHSTDPDLNGKEAGKLYFSSFSFNIHNGLTLLARGGNGGEGWSGIATSKPGEKGGNGGDGAEVKVLVNDTYRHLINTANTIKLFDSLAEKTAQLSTWLALCKLAISTPPDLINAISAFSEGLETMDTETQKENLDFILDRLDGESDHFLSSMIQIDVQGGSYGSGGDGTKPGDDGKEGVGATYKKRLMSIRTIHDSDECLFHPDQVALVLRDIENNYFIGTKSSLNLASATISLYANQLAFLNSLQPEHEIYKAYAANEDRFFVLRPESPPEGSKRGEPTSISSLRGSLRRISCYGGQIASGNDFYGHGKNWAPQGSFVQYLHDLEIVLDKFIIVENNYLKYQARAGNQQSRADNIDVARQAAAETKAVAKIKLKALEDEMKLSATRIFVFENLFKGRLALLSTELLLAASNIQNNFHVGFTDFINALTMMCFSPTLEMGTVQGANLIYEGMTKVSDDMGQKWETDYVVRRILTLKEGMEGLDEAVNEISKSGELAVDDPAATKIIGSEADIMALVGKYRGLLGDKALKDLQSSFDDYVELVLQRNNEILHYNACIILWLEAKQEAATAAAAEATLGRKAVKTLDYELPLIAATVQRSFFDATNDVLELLYKTQRALRYCNLTIDDTNQLTLLRQKGFPQPGLTAEFIIVRNSFYLQINHLLDRGRPVGQAFGIEGHASERGEHNEPIRVFLTDTELEHLKRPNFEHNHSLLLILAPALPDTTIETNAFAGWSDVRITTARFYLRGAKTTNENNKILIGLEHSGSETIVNGVGMKFQFQRKNIGFQFSYSLETGKITTDGNLIEQIDNKLALPSPFCPWRVEITKSLNKGLELSDVTEAWFEFSGYARKFGWD